MEEHTPLPSSPPTTWASRLGSFSLASVLTFLWIWLLIFLLSDVGRVKPLRYGPMYEAGMPAELLEELAGVDGEVASQQKRIERQAQLQRDLERDMEQSGEVMRQMMELQRLALEKGSAPTEAERDALAVAQDTFLSSQAQFRGANAEIQGANATLFDLRERREALQVKEDAAEAPILARYEKERRARSFWEASVRLGLTIPLFLVAAFLVWKRWRHAWRPIYMSFLLATFWTVGREMFDRFPAEYFKYIAILSSIGITLAFLGWMIRKATSPTPGLVLARNRAAYMGNTCPVCAFKLSPVPRERGVFGALASRSAGGAPAVPGASARAELSCPSCGTRLYEACAECSATRHSLLPFCEGCGAEAPGALTVPAARI